MKVKNISGGPVHFPIIGNRDIAPDEVVEVPDDTNLPTAYFQQVTDKPAAKAKDKE